MKPMGTITKYYPFIDEESKSILNSVMSESSSYFDFVNRLCDVVVENEVPVNLAYIAAVQAWWCRTEERMKLIQEKYKNVLWIKPWGYVHGTLESDQILHHDTVVEAIEELTETNPDDWSLAELHLLHAHFHWPMFGDIPSLLEPVEKVKQLIAANPLLKCFESQVCFYEGWSKRIEGDIEDAIVDYKRGIELAEAHDEALHKYMNLGGLGDVLKNINIKEAIARFEEDYDLVQDLEVPFLEGDVLHDSGLVFLVAGEYDLAISCFVETCKALGLSNTPSPMLARTYVDLGDGQQALDIINQYIEYSGQIEIPVAFISKARALALLNRLDEAQKNLDKARELVMKSGLDRLLGRYYQASALLELAKRDYPAAMDFFEKSWDLFERVGEMTGEKNRALLGLAQAEILLANQTTDVKKSITPGRWLSKLERYAVERDLPGIRMQAALLMSEFYQNHGQLKDAHATLQDALTITDSLGVASLRKRISDRIRELNQLLKEAEVSTEKKKE
jgi:tetratricopeptide (TPR) repeat protein